MTTITLESLQSLFAWSIVLNSAFFAVTVAFLAIMPDFVYRTQTIFFDIKQEDFTLSMYRFLAQYKLLIIVFCLTPYIALRIVL